MEKIKIRGGEKSQSKLAVGVNKYFMLHAVCNA